MSDVLVGWTRFELADGFIYVPAAGPSEGLVRVREGVALRRFRDVIDEMIQDGGDEYRRTTIGALRRFTTHEGESAGAVTLVVTADSGDVVERTVALVAGDTTSVIVDAATDRRELFERYRAIALELAVGWYFGLGHERQRRFEYTPPSGWPAIGRPHAVRYLHPAYPRVDVSITVFDAWPQKLSPMLLRNRSLVLESLDERTPAAAPEPIALPGGLSGHVTPYSKTRGGVAVHTVRLVLTDDRFVYCARLDASALAGDDGDEAFRALAVSIEPIPRPQTEEPVWSSWVD